jgi:CubicO group peptidase (beta-lactamase class C family)
MPTDTPEHHGMRSAVLNAWRDRIAVRNTTALLVLRDDKIVLEWYAAGYGATKKQGTASLAKAIVGGTSLMLAMQNGWIKPDDFAAKYIQRWRSDPLKSRITIRQLASHTSGIEDAEQDDIDHAKLPGWKGDFWRRTPDPFSIALDHAPVLFPPGTNHAYSNPGMAALAYAVTASLKGPQKDIRALLAAQLMEPIGIPSSDWSIGYDHAYIVDGLTLYANWGGGQFTPRAVARIGQLMLHRGEWNGKRVVSPAVAQTMTSVAGMASPDRSPNNPGPVPGLCWWLNTDGEWPEVPRDAFLGIGAGQKMLLVVPSLNLVVVRMGTSLGSEDDYWKDTVEMLINPAVRAARSHPPYPPSPVIGKITFAPESQIVRRAIDSDNWPITWGDDDAQYAAYGDGEGFEPFVDRKLSLGFAKIVGSPSAFEGINIRSDSGERLGGGAKGLKASGMLMVDGILYMWVRNAANAQLAWSDNHGRDWHWGFHLTQSFGSPAFLNFGRNYSGARDGFVYSYSQDGGDAYQSSDGVVLARVPKARLRELEAYEYFAGLDGRGNPRWTKKIEDRRPVFVFSGRCQRVDAVYNPLLKRYLMAVGYNHEGGWGLYDAPEPWGPWTTAFHTDYWGLGGTHGYRLPAKWIGPDVGTMQIVFSGVSLPGITYDAFCVRSITIERRDR